MNWRVALLLLALVLGLGAYVLYLNRQEPAPLPEPTKTPAPAGAEERRLFDTVTLDSIQRLEISAAQGMTRTVVAQSEPGRWQQVEPGVTELISNTVSNQVTGLVTLTSRRSFGPEDNPLSAYGLEEPAWVIQLAFTRDGQTVRQSLNVGKAIPGSAAYYVQLKGNLRVYVVGSAVIDNMIRLAESPPVLLPTPTPLPTPTVEATATLTTTLPTATAPATGTPAP